ncbi:hypothetical protein P7C71_g5729, partial [Lecanoromycetidae sp. Uapishka_2]
MSSTQSNFTDLFLRDGLKTGKVVSQNSDSKTVKVYNDWLGGDMNVVKKNPGKTFTKDMEVTFKVIKGFAVDFKEPGEVEAEDEAKDEAKDEPEKESKKAA